MPTVLITGASSGVGAAAARRFAEDGFDVALLARGRYGLEQVAADVRDRGRRALVLPADVTDMAAMEAAVAETVNALGSLDVLLVNAAATAFGRFQEISTEDFDRAVAVTFTGGVNTVRAALPALERSGGTIVATGSLMCRLPLPTFSSYAAAKHALRGFLNTLRAELRSRRSPVTISMVHPGTLNTPVWRYTSSSGGRLPRHPPWGYAPETVAEVLLSLAYRPRPEIVIGAETKAVQVLYDYARPAGELLFAVVDRWYGSGRGEAAKVDSLYEPVGAGEARDGVFTRPSLTTPLRLALRRRSRR
jgi:NAD(P)-dependent dehydrogenase (short-subunit alcohol dehydrogenase family)